MLKSQNTSLRIRFAIALPHICLRQVRIPEPSRFSWASETSRLQHDICTCRPRTCKWRSNPSSSFPSPVRRTGRDLESSINRNEPAHRGGGRYPPCSGRPLRGTEPILAWNPTTQRTASDHPLPRRSRLGTNDQRGAIPPPHLPVSASATTRQEAVNAAPSGKDDLSRKWILEKERVSPLTTGLEPYCSLFMTQGL